MIENAVNGFTIGCLIGVIIGFIWVSTRFSFKRSEMLTSLTEQELINEVKDRRYMKALKDKINIDTEAEMSNDK